MRLHDGENYLEFDVVERLDCRSQGERDTNFFVRVRVSHVGVSDIETVFTAETTCWIGFGELVCFAEQLRTLEKRRVGSANLKSMSPDELELEIRSTDGVGHVAAFGYVGCSVPCWLDSGKLLRHVPKVSFAIPFDPSELASLCVEFGRLAAR
jgi:hypothetical protein